MLTGATAQNHSNQAPTAGTLNGNTVTSDEFDKIEVLGARSIAIQMLDDTDASTDLTLDVWSSLDGSTFDTAGYPYATMNIDASADTDTTNTMSVTPSPSHIRIRTSEGNVSTVATTINILVVWGD